MKYGDSFLIDLIMIILGDELQIHLFDIEGTLFLHGQIK